MHSVKLASYVSEVSILSQCNHNQHLKTVEVIILKEGWGNQKSGNADSLNRKKGERVSNSGSGEEREGVTVCSAAVRRGVKDGRREG